MEIVVGGKSSRVSDAIPELNLEQLEPIVERVVERVVKRVVAPPRRLITVKEMAQANGIGLTLAYEELNAGRLEAIKVGSKTMISPEAEAAWKARLRRYKPADAMDELKSKQADTTNELGSA
jgi:DNA-binding transcriptional regulator YhcF (GntR family)